MSSGRPRRPTARYRSLAPRRPPRRVGAGEPGLPAAGRRPSPGSRAAAGRSVRGGVAHPLSEEGELRDPTAPAEPSPAPLELYAWEQSLDTTSLEELESVHRSADRDWLDALFRASPALGEVARLATCHRVELFLVSSSEPAAQRFAHKLPGRPAAWKARTGRDAIRHLFRVASGHGSLADGEKEIRLQVRSAGGASLCRLPRPVLREIFGAAADAADSVAPEVAPERSIAAVAASELLRLLPGPRRRVLVIGAGIVGRQVVEALAGRVEVTMAYRSRPPDPGFLRATHSRAVPIAALPKELRRADGVVTAAKSGDRCLGPEDLVSDRDLVLVDLGVPRNVDPSVRRSPRVRLIDLEALHESVRAPLATREDPALARLTEECGDRWEARALQPWIDTVRRQAESVRRSEIAVAREFLGRLTPDQEQALDRLTRRLVSRLLLASTERLRTLPPGAEGDRFRQFALELLRVRNGAPDPLPGRG